MEKLMLKTKDLKPSVSNVRSRHAPEDVIMMANSLKRRGMINPLSVAKNGDGRYEVVAGLLRYKGALMAGLEDVPCEDISHLSESARVEISLSENVDRKQMTAMQYYAAFNKLFKAGMPVGKIGERFNKTEREVQQYLAIGSLPKKILDLYDNNEVGDRTIEALAIATGADVVRYTKLKAGERPRDWDIQNWLAGEKGRFQQQYAIFDIEKYVGPKIVDLFAKEDEVWLTDGAQFMTLQNTAALEKIADFEKKGWKCELVDHWQQWAYDKTAKANGGKVFWSKDNRTGAVEFHAGYKRHVKAGTTPKTKGKTDKQSEISQAFTDYCTELRHNAVRAHMVTNKKAGLIGTIVVLLKQCDGISFSYNGGRIKNQGYVDSINEQYDNLDIQDARINAWDEMGVKDGHTWDIKIAGLVKKLEGYPTATLQRFIIAIVTANWYLQSNGKDSDALGKAFGLNGVDRIMLDDSFWDGIKNKATLLKIAKEHKISINKKMTVKVIREKVKTGVPDSWLPDWLTF